MAGVFRSSFTGEILECNTSFARILGYDSSEEIRQGGAVCLHTDEPSREAILGTLHEKGFLRSRILTLRGKDGVPLRVMLNASVVPDREGRREWIEGTVVNLESIAATDPAETTSKPNASKQRPLVLGDPMRVLLVDDEYAARKALDELLQALGFKVETAASCRTAVELLQSRPFDLLVTDLRLGGEDGLDLAAIALDLNPDRQILLMTGYIDDARLRSDFVKASVTVLEKPFDLQTLSRALSGLGLLPHGSPSDP